MIVVLEGPDFAGKSALAARLASGDSSFRIVANGPPPVGVDLASHYLAQVRAARESGFTIFDRLHIGELIYGPRLRGESRLSQRGLELLEAELDEAPALKIHVDASDGDLIKRFRGLRGDDLITREEDLLAIARDYRSWLGTGGRLGGWKTWRIGDPLPAR